MSDERRIMLNHVKVGERARRDLGDLTDLMESIKEVGLLQPIVLDDQDRLIAGQRRLESVRKLGWPSIPYVTAKRVKDATQHLLAERDENTCRKAMTPTEVKTIADQLRDLHAPEAKARQVANLNTAPDPELSPSGDNSGKKTDDLVAEALGTSATTLRRIDEVVETAEDEEAPEEVREVAQQAQTDMDEGTISVAKAHSQVKEAKAKASPKKPNRTPLPKLAEKAGWDLRKVVERIEKIAADDRYAANAEQVATGLRGHLTYTAEVCQTLLSGFSSEEN